MNNFPCSKSTFERMRSDDYDDTYNDMTYEQFRQWNMTCLNELSEEDRLWVQSLCNRIKSRKIKLMDEESCATFTASNIYFDLKKRICIMNPR